MGDVLEHRSICPPPRLKSSIELDNALVENNRRVVNPHVLLVRGSIFNRNDGSDGVLRGLVGDWLRTSWPVRVYWQDDKMLASSISHRFSTVGVGGGRVPVCSCQVSPGDAHTRISCYKRPRN